MTRPAVELVRHVVRGESVAANWLPTGGHAGTHHARYATLAVLGCPDHGLTAEYYGTDAAGQWQCRVCKLVLETCCAGAPLVGLFAEAAQ